MDLFETLQRKHLGLIEFTEKTKLPDAQRLSEVEDFIKELREAGSLISDPRQRNQLRTLLRFWGSFIYDQKEEFPDTQLLPISPEVEKQVGLGSKQRRRWSSISVITAISGSLLIVLVAVFLPHFFESSQPDVVIIKEWNLRKAPNPTSAIQETLSKGTTLSIIGQAEGGYWLYVRSNTSGREGWIANRADGVSVNVNPSHIPLVNTPTPRPTVNFAEIVSSSTLTVMPTSTSTPTARPTSTPILEPVITATVIVTSSSTTTPTPTGSPTPTLTDTPTSTPTPTPTLYPAPVLIAPESGSGVHGTFPPLYWDWVRELEEDEYFEVRLWHESISPYRPSLGWVKAPVFDYNIAGARAGEYYWTVAVVRDKDVRLKDWYKPELWPYPVWEHDPAQPPDSIQLVSQESELRFFFFDPPDEGEPASPISPPCSSNDPGC